MAAEPGDHQEDQINPKLHYIIKYDFFEFYTKNYQHEPMADCFPLHGSKGRGTRWTVPRRSFTKPIAQGQHRTDSDFLSDDHAFVCTDLCGLFSLEASAEVELPCGAGSEECRASTQIAHAESGEFPGRDV